MVKPYCIGSDEWNGLSKLIEECGEVLQVAGKIIGAEGETLHWDGTDLRERLTKEMGDLIAAVEYVTVKNELDIAAMRAQADSKLTLFRRWDSQTRDAAA
jgi:NTP pyrophosphatase (non-canonical NTP hydrolase)